MAVQQFYEQRSLYTHTQAASASSVCEAGSCVVVFVFVAVRKPPSALSQALKEEHAPEIEKNRKKQSIAICGNANETN